MVYIPIKVFIYYHFGRAKIRASTLDQVATGYPDVSAAQPSKGRLLWGNSLHPSWFLRVEYYKGRWD